jgi:hypothetical protein
MTNKEKKFKKILKEIYQSNKNQFIKTKKARIISLDLISKLKDLNCVIELELEFVFSMNQSIQKIVANQGFLLPYKFSKKIEKEKIALFLLRENDSISNLEFEAFIFQLNQSIEQQIEVLIKENYKVNFKVIETRIS